MLNINRKFNHKNKVKKGIATFGELNVRFHL